MAGDTVASAYAQYASQQKESPPLLPPDVGQPQPALARAGITPRAMREPGQVSSIPDLHSGEHPDANAIPQRMYDDLDGISQHQHTPDQYEWRVRAGARPAANSVWSTPTVYEVEERWEMKCEMYGGVRNVSTTSSSGLEAIEGTWPVSHCMEGVAPFFDAGRGIRFMDGPPCWLSLLLSSPASSTSRQRFGAWKGALEQLMSRSSAAPGPPSAMLSASEVALPTQQIRPAKCVMYIDAASESPRRKCPQKSASVRRTVVRRGERERQRVQTPLQSFGIR